MKKWLSAVIAIVMAMALLAGCSGKTDDAGNKNDTYQSVKMNVAGLNGPTGIGMARLMEQSDAGETANEYTFQLVGAPTEITAKLTSGEVDIAAVPTNLAATLYNKSGGDIQMLAVNTLGVLSIVENGDTVKTLEDLRGKTLYASGQGSTAEYVLNYLLEEAGLTIGEDIQVEYKSEHSELAALVTSGEVDIAMLPQPFVTTVMMNNEDLRLAVDLTEAWENTANGNALTMGAIVVRTEFAKENPAAVEKFLSEYKASAEYVNSNVDETATLVQKYGIIEKLEVAKKAIPNCNIVYMDGTDMKASVTGFFEVLLNADPQSIGGAIPDDAFFYNAG